MERGQHLKKRPPTEAASLRWAKPDSLALHPALVDLRPTSRSIRQFGLEDWPPSQPGPPQALGRLWIARTQEPSLPDASNTIYRSLYFPRGMPPAPRPLRRNWTFVPNRKYKSELKGGCAPKDTSFCKCSGFKLGHCEIQLRPLRVKTGQHPAAHGNRLATPEPFPNSADADRMSVEGVRRAKAALSSGCKSHPATAPAGSNRSSHGGNEVAEAFD
jgi:hypothetical protein